MHPQCTTLRPNTRVPRTCRYCAAAFTAFWKNVRQGHGRYCSKRCMDLARRGDPIARFWAHVDQSAGPDGCWPWLRARAKGGYGLTTLPAGGKMRRAPKVAWELANGQPFPADLWALHTCHNPPCCNPRHIYPGTPQNNADDRVAAGHTAMIQGERNRHARLTPDDVRFIRSHYGEPGYDRPSLAQRFGVTPTAITNITRRRTWRHLP